MNFNTGRCTLHLLVKPGHCNTGTVHHPRAVRKAQCNAAFKLVGPVCGMDADAVTIRHSLQYVQLLVEAGTESEPHGVLADRDARHAALVPKLPQHLAANGHFEQATLNYAVHAFATPLHYLEQTWNTIHPDVGQPMRSFFYHFTGMDFGERRSRLSDYDWRAVPTGD